VDYYDLCIAWNWEYDTDFVRVLETACTEHSVSLLQITPFSLFASCASLRDGQLAFGTLLDRATDADAQFLPIVQWAQRRGSVNINLHHKARRARDKALMHRDFVAAGLSVPRTVILPPFSQQPNMPAPDLSQLGPLFSIKPACRGGGKGVVNAASSLEEVYAARQQYPDDHYLLQAHVEPMHLEPGKAWFRLIYCLGQVHPCWWDVETHIYEILQRSEQMEHVFDTLSALAAQIAALCGLGLFSTEVALTDGGDYVIVDYVNDPLDLRLQSKAVDGVPDTVVRAVADQVALLAARGR
jgi:glutathione synthase/RimK-type ligase-like ATP-grasp enzyme